MAIKETDHVQCGHAINVSNWLIDNDEIKNILKNGLNWIVCFLGLNK